MNKVVLKFGEKEYLAKFGIGFIGRYLAKSEIKIDKLLSDFEENTFLRVPDMMYNAIIEGTPEFSLTESEFEDLIDEDGGFLSKQIERFIIAFAESIKVNFPNEGKDLGKPKPKAKKS